MVKQIEILLPEYPRGFHLITSVLKKNLPELPETGMINFFLKHTSAAITVNENADPLVRMDFHSFINKMIPDNADIYTHICEGYDDMSAHIKSSLFGISINIPISNHEMNLGTWQGVYLCEFRNNGGQRKILASIFS
ncbi:MAG: secondary thiamine-phosphate synthase enzyme YjbQ [Bacteroidota bacterium]